tara:strand:+ start:348 stop:698 length:351 start_codon:yes stop_codon:yes gene_type:complete
MPKHYKEMIDEIINKMDEDAPANSASGGGVDLNPTGANPMAPSIVKRKKKQGKEQDKISTKISKMVKANEDNNSMLLKQINSGIEKVEMKIDEDIYGKTEIKVEPEYKTFKEKYNA